MSHPPRVFRFIFARALFLCLALAASLSPARSTAAPELPPYAPRLNFGAPLEPVDRVLHGAGQDWDGYRTYADLHAPEKRPAVYMTYIGVPGTVAEIEAWGTQMIADLGRIHDHQPILQVGLALMGPGKPLDAAVAAGEFDAQIEAFADALARVKRPALVRIGYEFEGHWNGYKPESFVICWKKITTAIRARQMPVAVVWCAAGPAAGWKDLSTVMAFYPGDEWVDWWGIDLFDPHDIEDARTLAFLDRARAHRKPVLIGESSPKGVGVLDGQASWDKWFVPYFRLIRTRPEIKGFCYISWEWSYWARKYGFDWHDWGDCRLEQNKLVTERWVQELNAPIYLHGLPTTPPALPPATIP